MCERISYDSYGEFAFPSVKPNNENTVLLDVLLPLYAVTYEFTETKATETERDVNEAAKIFAEQKQEEMKFVGEFESSYTVTPIAGGLYSVHVFLSGETLISRGVV